MSFFISGIQEIQQRISIFDYCTVYLTVTGGITNLKIISKTLIFTARRQLLYTTWKPVPSTTTTKKHIRHTTSCRKYKIAQPSKKSLQPHSNYTHSQFKIMRYSDGRNPFDTNAQSYSYNTVPFSLIFDT